MSSSTIRAFIGLRIPENLSAQMNDVSATLASQDRGQMSWVAEDNYHVTLLFLGDQTERWLEDLAELIADEVDLSAQKIRRFRPHITLARKFPRSGQLMIPSVANVVGDIATELVIYESKLSASGAEYYPIFEFDLF